MKTATVVLALSLIGLTACSGDAEPLTSEQKKDIPAMKELMRECADKPPRVGTQAAANCKSAQAAVMFQPPTRERVRDAYNAT
jgi:hypothetical protein